jgi:hypothetical protein
VRYSVSHVAQTLHDHVRTTHLTAQLGQLRLARRDT